VQEFKNLGDRVNGESAKIKKPDFVKYLKGTLSKKPNLSQVPEDNDGERV